MCTRNLSRIGAAGLGLLVLATAAPAGRTQDGVHAAEVFARGAAHQEGPVLWSRVVPYDAVDLLEFVDPTHLLVGTVTVGEKAGVPRHGALELVEPATGRTLWSAERASRPEGDYALLATSPGLLVMGSQGDEMELTSLDLANGKSRWSFRGRYPAAVAPVDGRLLVLSSPASTLTALDIDSGRTRWTRTLPPGTLAPGEAGRLLAGDREVRVAGRTLSTFAADTGQPRGSLSHPVLEGRYELVETPAGLVLWSAGHLVLVGPGAGKVTWERREVRQGVTDVAPGDGLLLCVLAGSPRGEAIGDDVVEALDLATGKPRWTHAVKDKVLSAVLAEGDRVHYTTETEVRSLNAGTGAIAGASPLPEKYAAWSPRRNRWLGLPDLLQVRGENLIVYRELIGLLAVSTSTGKLAWVQPHLGEYNDFAASEAVMLLRKLSDDEPRTGRLGGYARYEEPGPNPFLVAARRRQEEVHARTAAVLASRDATRLDRRAALAARLGASREVEVQQRIESSFGRMQAGMDLSFALWDLANQLRLQKLRRAVQGLSQRFGIQARGIMRAKERLFQGRYLVAPFTEGTLGTGATLFDLDTGKRADFLTGAYVNAFEAFGVYLPTLALDPAGTTLFTVGVDYDPKRWEIHKKWGWRLPRPALRAFDVGKLRWTDEPASFQAR